jgi:hypothetical protein
MANQKISALSSGNPAASSDELVIARSGANYKVTAASVAALRLPAGSTTQVQYNLAGALAGSVNMTFSGSTLTLGVAGTAGGALALKGSTSGTATLQTAAAAGAVTVTLPAVTDTLAVLGANTFTGAQTLSDVDIVLGTTTGTKIGTATAQKLGFYNATPVVQQATTGTTTGFTAGGPANGVHADSTFTGNSGTKAYTIGDIVRALKNLGLLAAS